ncbi:PTS IIB subunit [Cryobacterium tepidiphilum]|uniref:PTS IIB subunit n=2 Tax=Cryobacterium tepidiphilum TaxID=2486026 RepID=A0A3M8LES6_9MICO|nr:PTS IIB subunit [Cryobacterium tepidiphilum]
MKILIICGAGASSTFVAHRLRRSAAEQGVAAEISAGSESDLPARLAGLDVLLIGPHLAGRFDEIRASASAADVAVALLPETIFRERDGQVALGLALDAAGTRS